MFAVSVAADADAQEATRATFMITGLHCPPCVRTVESSLSAAKGISSAKVDWKTKSAKFTFDESTISAQQVAELVASTPHMMGGRMQYAAQLAMSVPGVKDEVSASAAKQALTAVAGIQSVATFPHQHTISVRFSQKGNVTSRDLIAALDKAGFKARVY